MNANNLIAPISRSIAYIIALTVAVSPIFFKHLYYDLAQSLHSPQTFKCISIIFPLAAIYWCYCVKIDIPREKKVMLFVLLLGLSALLVDLHLVYIDEPSNFASTYFNDTTNISWQLRVHNYILALDPAALPNTYRFLPDALVEVLAGLTDFAYAKLIYRETFMFLLLYSIFYYAKLYTRHEVALMTTLFYAIIYQVSIRYYAGQLTDPMSHLSFVLAFIFIEKDAWLNLFFTIVVGIMAKETIIVMCLVYMLVKKGSWGRKSTLMLAAAAMMIGIRLLMVKDFEIKLISGVNPLDHIMNNLAEYDQWPRQLLFSVGILVPFVFVAWRTTHRNVKLSILVLFPSLLVSNLLFSWLSEARNFIPVVIPMTMMTANYFFDRQHGTIASG